MDFVRACELVGAETSLSVDALEAGSGSLSENSAENSRLASHAGSCQAHCASMLPRRQRITRGSDYAGVARRGRVFRGPLVMVRTLWNNNDCTRFGLVVSRAVGNSVVRNRIKRRLRGILRGVPVHKGWDLALIHI